MIINRFCKNTEKTYKKYQNQIKLKLLKEKPYTKDSDAINFINSFKEKIINSIMGQMLNILIDDIFIDNEYIKNQRVIFTPQNYSKSMIPKYIITDAGNYSESQEDTRLRSMSIILTDNCDLIAIIIGCGKTEIHCHSKHEYYGLINVLMGLNDLSISTHKNTIWINDIAESLGTQFLKDNNINLKYKYSNSALSNFAYQVMIKGICDSLLHHKQIFTHIMKGNHDGYIKDSHNFDNKYYTPVYSRKMSPKIIPCKPKMTFTSIEEIEDEIFDFEDFLNTIINDEVDKNAYQTKLIEQITPSKDQILEDLILLKNDNLLQINFSNVSAFQNIKLSNIKSKEDYLFQSVYIKDTILIQNSPLKYISKDILIADTMHLKNLDNIKELTGFVIVNKIIIENCPLFNITNFIKHYPHIHDIHYIK